MSVKTESDSVEDLTVALVLYFGAFQICGKWSETLTDGAVAVKLGTMTLDTVEPVPFPTPGSHPGVSWGAGSF